MEFNSKDPDDTLGSAEIGAVPLVDLPPGSEAVVARVDPAHPIGRRLLDLGFVPATPIRVVRRAPLGDPVTYELRGMRLCLRREEARRIWVRRAPQRPRARPDDSS